MRETILKQMSPRNRASYKLIFSYASIFIAFVGAMMIAPLGILIFYPEEWVCFLDFLVPGLACLIIGFSLSVFLRPKDLSQQKLGKHQDSVLLVLIWLLAIVLGAFPFFLADKFEPNQNAVSMNFFEAFFESMSGFTATGFTVFRDTLDGVEAYGLTSLYCPHVFLIYRAITQFIGGVGLVLVVASVLSDAYGSKLFYAEGHNDRLLPNLGKTAKLTFGIYFGIIALGTFALWLCGLDWFEALCYSIAAMATGGFATRSSGFYYPYSGNGVFGYNQIGAESVVCIVMILGATSFLLLFNLVLFRFKNFFRDCELRFATVFMIVAITLAVAGVSYQYIDGMDRGLDFLTASRYGVFQVISCLTTCGFSNAPSLPQLGSITITISIVAMLIGGGMGSTAGAIKQYRIILAFKELWWSIKYRLSPARQMHPRLVVRAGEISEVGQEDYRSASLYILLYLFVIAILTGALSAANNFTVESALYEVASALSGTGNSVVGQTAYKDAMNPEWSYNLYLGIMDLAMILGRLEILPLYYALVRVVKDILRKETV